ncbi:glycoprotein-N-acetylgalactosamine 3-beta-galactosyltransferase 1-like [Scaptodrosophila lebanonensis]|uniref:Glycoprotein-N-acetylgalactosamine 3-beta-galactosyltransferase 1 n=1 Tax=Drosophila lebanonensis TaxID=7225 RepID=A0A6J2TMM4_DROLE|nr:glycoprotein-N-acetylgalactosamine 3-beta-galactosyltransferase 1-like [Scaptodrosophila lebanonensis]
MNIFRRKRKVLVFLFTFLMGTLLGFSLSQMMLQSCWHSDDNAGHPTSMARYAEHLTVQTGINNPADEDPPLATKLYKETKVLCMILTSPKSHQSRALHVKRTWGARCNKLLFMSTKTDKDLPIVALNVTEGYWSLWGKTRESFRYVYERYFRDYDWFLKADDDTYVVVENLRAFLYAYTARAPVYFGKKLRNKQTMYMSGGAGYVLSKAALERFVTKAYRNGSICKNTKTGFEDLELGRCLRNVGVVRGSSLNKQGVQLFQPFPPTRRDISWHSRKFCCPELVISFHYSKPSDFYVLDYAIYKLWPFGLPRRTEELPEKKQMLDILRKWREDDDRM